MPEQVEACVKSVLEENPDYSESRAYAICNAQFNYDGDPEDIAVESLAAVGVDAEAVDELAATHPEWERTETEAATVWVDTDAGAAVYQASDSDGDEQARVAGDAVVVEGLSAEARDALESKYNVDIRESD